MSETPRRYPLRYWRGREAITAERAVNINYYCWAGGAAALIITAERSAQHQVDVDALYCHMVSLVIPFACF